MKTLIALALYFGVASVTLGGVFTKVYLADGKTPLELADPNIPLLYRDVMAGTRLTIIVSSDSGGYWGGDLAITGEDLKCHHACRKVLRR